MANMTKPIHEQLADLCTAADGGLPADLKNFVDLTTTMLWNCSETHFPRRKDLQAYVDTLTSLIDTAVNNPRRAPAAPVKPKTEPIKKATPKVQTPPIVRTVKKVRVGATRISRSKA